MKRINAERVVWIVKQCIFCVILVLMWWFLNEHAYAKTKSRVPGWDLCTVEGCTNYTVWGTNLCGGHTEFTEEEKSGLYIDTILGYKKWMAWLSHQCLYPDCDEMACYESKYCIYHECRYYDGDITCYELAVNFEQDYDILRNMVEDQYCQLHLEKVQQERVAKKKKRSTSSKSKVPKYTSSRYDAEEKGSSSRKKMKKQEIMMPDCDDFEDYGDFMDTWDGCMPDGSDAEEYWENW